MQRKLLQGVATGFQSYLRFVYRIHVGARDFYRYMAVPQREIAGAFTIMSWPTYSGRVLASCFEGYIQQTFMFFVLFMVILQRPIGNCSTWNTNDPEFSSVILGLVHDLPLSCVAVALI